MKKCVKSLLLISTIMFVFLNCAVAFAHSGRTDSAGGHYDNDIGEYHYHEGHEAHYHPDGTCPYGYDVNETTEHYSKTVSPENDILRLIATIVVIFVVLFLLIYLSVKHVRKKKAHAYAEILKDKISDLEKEKSKLLNLSKYKISQRKYELNYQKNDLRYKLENVFDEIINKVYADEIERSKLLEIINSIVDILPEYYYQLFYCNQDLNKLCGIPKEYCFFGDTLFKMKDGRFVPDGMFVYISFTGKKYHSKYGCHGADHYIHVTKDSDELLLKEPCSVCYNNKLNDWINNRWDSWYNDYIRNYKLKEKYFAYFRSEYVHTKLNRVTDNSLIEPAHNRQEILERIIPMTPKPQLFIYPYNNAKGESVFIVLAKFNCVTFDIGELNKKRSNQIYDNLDKKILVRIDEITGIDNQYNLGCNVSIEFIW